MNGIGTLPPGLAGWVLGDQINQQKRAGQMQEMQGILGLQGALRQQAIDEQTLPLKLKLLQAQADKAGRPENPFSKIDPSKFTQDSINKFIATGGTNFGLLEPVRNLSFQNTGGQTLGLDPVTGAQRVSFSNTNTPHQAWQQNTQFPWTQQVDRTRLSNEGARIGIDAANLYFNTGMGPMGGGARVPGGMPSAMDGAPRLPAAPVPQSGVVPPRGAPAVPQNFVPPNAQLPQPGRPTLPPKAVLEVEIDRQKKAGEFAAKREFNMADIGNVISEAEKILTSGRPTSSGIGAAQDFVGSLVGYTPDGAREADQLKAIGGALVSKMPRMEGPQSDRDVETYREMAGRIGDNTIPIPRRLAALQAVKELWAKYDKNAPAQDRRSEPRQSSRRIVVDY
jgi:hypothetical protein